MAIQPAIKAREIVRDFRAGMSDARLLMKYNLSCAGLREVVRRLIERRVLSRIELDSRMKAQEQVPLAIDFRETERTKPGYDIPVFDLQTSDTPGTLLDVSTKGLQISGIPATVGETSSLRVGTEFGEFPSFIFQGQCQWFEKEGGPYNRSRAGYQITNISYDAFRQLQHLIQNCATSPKKRVPWDRRNPGRRSSGGGPDFDKL